MASTPTTSPGLKIWHWNANGFRCRKAVLQQHLLSIEQPPDIIMIQETHTENAPSLPGYRAHASPPSVRDCGKGAAQGVCTFVRKGLTFIKHEKFLGRSTIEHCATEVVIGKKRQESFLLVKVYSNPTHRQQKFKALLHKATRTAPSEAIAICGDFNAPHKELGYSRTTVKGRDLLDEATNAGFILYTNPATPTRIGTSTTRDTTPDLSFVRVSDRTKGDVRWSNTGHNLGSDHYILELVLPTVRPHTAEQRRKHRLTDWARFRSVTEGTQKDIADIDEWTSAIKQAASEVTTELDTDDDIQQVDSKLAHMIEARQSMQRRWKRQRHNRRLRKRVAELGRAIEKYSQDLCTQRWYAACSAADGPLHKGQTWKLLRHLLDDTSTRGYQQHRLSQTMLTAIKELGEEETGKRINAKYLPSTAAEQHEEYQGAANPTLDQDIEEWEVRAVLQELNCKSAAGPDQVPNKALRNLNDGAVTALTKYFNRCCACSIRAPSACQAEEVAIALALTDRRCSTILSDSRSAIKIYARNSEYDYEVVHRTGKTNQNAESLSGTPVRALDIFVPSVEEARMKREQLDDPGLQKTVNSLKAGDSEEQYYVDDGGLLRFREKAGGDVVAPP
ncbi:uncharacterized protein LOC144168052 [Haemaphysalis longicornis]